MKKNFVSNSLNTILRKMEKHVSIVLVFSVVLLLSSPLAHAISFGNESVVPEGSIQPLTTVDDISSEIIGSVASDYDESEELSQNIVSSIPVTSIEDVYEISDDVFTHSDDLIGSKDKNSMPIIDVDMKNDLEITSDLNGEEYALNINQSTNKNSELTLSYIQLLGITDTIIDPATVLSFETDCIFTILYLGVPDGANIVVKLNGVEVAYSGSTFMDLSMGANTVEVILTSDDGSIQNTYTITINRVLSSKAKISSLYIDNFLEQVYEPELTYSFDTELLNTYVSFSNPYGATIVTYVNGEIQNNTEYVIYVTLVPGENTIELVVTSADGSTTNNYLITINRELSSRATISDLSIYNILEYVHEPELTYSFETELMNTHLWFSNPYGATIAASVNGEIQNNIDNGISVALVPGENTIELIVTSADGSATNTYTITINRELSSRATISDLIINNILEQVYEPELTYSFETELLSTHLWFSNPYGATIAASVNGETQNNIDNGISVELVPGENTIELIVTSADGSTTNVYTITINRELSSRATISDLIINNILEQVYEPELTYSFETELLSTHLWFSNPYGATIAASVNGEIQNNIDNGISVELVPGENTIEFVVTSADGSATNVYTITINRELSSRATISDLSIYNILEYVYEPEFSYSVDTEVFNTYVSFTNPYGATIAASVNGEIQTNADYGISVELVPGENTIELIVTSADGSATNTYIITINRVLSSRATISDLSIYNILEYVHEPELTYSVDTEVFNTYVSFTNPYGATIAASVNGEIQTNADYGISVELVPGENTIELIVTSADGSATNTYIITINRVLSSRATISDLIINNILEQVYEPELTYSFETELLNTHLWFSNPYGATIAASVNGEIQNNIDNGISVELVLGENTIELVVTSADGSATNTYTITINRELSSRATISDLFIYNILERVHEPELTYSFETELLNTHLWFSNPYGATIVASFNGEIQNDIDNGIYVELVPGENTIELVVTSADGSTTNVYTITINRELSSRATISDLSIYNILEYVHEPELTYSFDTELFNTYVGFSNPYGATIAASVNGEIQNNIDNGISVELVLGENTIELIVTSADGSATNTYIITINRVLSSRATISDLSIYNILEYVHEPELAYSFDTELSNASVSFSNPYGATIVASFNGEIQNDIDNGIYVELVPGENTIELVVTSADGSATNTYTITINRELSSRATISDLFIYNILERVHEPELTYSFETEILGTQLWFSNSYGATIEASVNGESYYVSDNWIPIDLVLGENTIELFVTSADGSTTNTYTITINRELSSRATISDLYIYNILEYVHEPELTYSVDTELLDAFVRFSNPYGATIVASVNGEVINNNADYGIYVELVPGENTIELVVTSMDGLNTNTYTIIINRELSSRATISDLYLYGILEQVHEPELTYSVDTEVFNTYVGFSNPYGATIQMSLNGEILFPDDSFNLITGQNIIQIIVTSADGINSSIYTLLINRTKSTKAAITGLHIPEILGYVEEPDLQYNLTTELKRITLEFTNRYEGHITVAHNGVVLTNTNNYFYPINLDVGSNLITIQVIAENGVNNVTYEIKIERVYTDDRALIKDLYIEQVLEHQSNPELFYDLEADDIVRSYFSYSNPYNANVTAYLNGVKVGIGYINLLIGENLIELIVTSADGSSHNSYQIRINRESLSSKAELQYLTVLPVLEYESHPDLLYSSETIESATYIDFRNIYGCTVTTKLNGVLIERGWHDLLIGDNIIEISLVSEDGLKTKTHKVVLTRILSNKAEIQYLQLSNLLDASYPGLEYALETERSYTYIRFSNPYKAEFTVSLNGSVLTNESTNEYGFISDVFLQPGLNTIRIDVTSSDDSTSRVYVITIDRKLSSQALIKNLSLFKIGFYSINPEDYYEINTIEPYARLSFDNPYGAEVHVEINGDSQPVDSNYYFRLLPGFNTININVNSSDGLNESHYTLKIYRIINENAGIYNVSIRQIGYINAEPPSFSEYFTELAECTLDFSTFPGSDVTVYLNNVLLEPTLYDQYKLNFIRGFNNLVITSTSSDGSEQKEYLFSIYRSDNTMNEIIRLSVDGILECVAQPDEVYNLSTELATANMSFRPSSSNVSVSLNNIPVKLVDGYYSLGFTEGHNIVTINVTSVDGLTTKEYELNITRTNEGSNALEHLAESLIDIVSEFTISPYIAGAAAQVRLSVVSQLEAMGESGVAVTITETAPPTLQPDGSYLGRYTVTLSRNGEQATRTLTYTQTKRVASLALIAEALQNVTGQFNTSPYIAGAAAQVRLSVVSQLEAMGESGVAVTITETAPPTLQPDGSYLGRYTVTLSRNGEQATRTLTYTQTKRVASLALIAEALQNVTGQFNTSPYIAGAAAQVRLSVVSQLEAMGESGVAVTITETAPPTLQPDGSYLGRYTVTLSRNGEQATRTLTYTQTKRVASLALIAEALQNVTGQFNTSPYIAGAAAQVRLSVVSQLEAMGESGVAVTITETAPPTLQPDGSYLGRYTVTLSRNGEQATRTLTYTQTKRVASLALIAEALQNVTGQFNTSPYIAGAAAQVRLSVVSQLEAMGESGVAVTITETAPPTLQPDGSYLGRYTVTLSRNGEQATRTLTYTQTKRVASLALIAEALQNVTGQFNTSPYIAGAAAQVRLSVVSQLEAMGESGVAVTITETAPPTLQPDGSYLGRYTVTLSRNGEQATRTLTYTQTKRVASLALIAEALQNVTGQFNTSPYIAGAAAQVRLSVVSQLEAMGESGVAVTITETAPPTLQPDGSYLGRYTVTLSRNGEQATRTLTYTQTKRVASLALIAEALQNVTGQFNTSPYIAGAAAQVRLSVVSQLEAMGESGVAVTITETAPPTLQPDGSYLGRYTVTLSRNGEQATRTLTYTQTKR